MKRTQLRDICMKLRTTESNVAYTKQRNYWVTLIIKTKKDYHDNLNVKDIR